MVINNIYFNSFVFISFCLVATFKRNSVLICCTNHRTSKRITKGPLTFTNMAQQAPKAAQSMGKRLVENLKSKEFREYLMR